MGSSPSLWAATAASYCPSRPRELPKLISTEYRIQPDVSPCISVLRGRGVQDCPLLRCRRRLLIRTTKGVTRAKETICCTEMSRKNLEQNQPSPPSRDFVGRPRHSCRPPCSSSSSAAPSGTCAENHCEKVLVVGFLKVQ